MRYNTIADRIIAAQAPERDAIRGGAILPYLAPLAIGGGCLFYAIGDGLRGGAQWGMLGAGLLVVLATVLIAVRDEWHDYREWDLRRRVIEARLPVVEQAPQPRQPRRWNSNVDSATPTLPFLAVLAKYARENQRRLPTVRDPLLLAAADGSKTTAERYIMRITLWGYVDGRGPNNPGTLRAGVGFAELREAAIEDDPNLANVAVATNWA